MQCPVVYANGRCTGQVHQVRAYGKHDTHGVVAENDVRKFRLWCSEKDDHGGAVGGLAAKERMEFYPDELIRRGLYEEAKAACENLKTV